MNFPRCSLIALCALVLASCGNEPQDIPEPPSRPVKVFTVEGIGEEAIRRFPGTVQASQRADLSFRVPGQLQEIKVREGETVDRGDLLARLDPTDYEIALEDRQASFDNARRNFQRAKDLVKDGNISQLDYDRMEAEFRTAQAALSQAEQNLEYTYLRAPFDGTVARREVENFEDVLAKQTIFRFQNVDVLDIVINLPESLVRNIQPDKASPDIGAGPPPDISATASFEGRDQSFPLSIREVATKADPQTQTFQVTLSMPQPESFRVLPGMTANVEVDFSDIVSVSDTAKWVPESAVQADSGLDPRVWVLDMETMTVSSKPVTIGRLSGTEIEVTSGLRGGEQIVSVGAHYLAEGMKVTRMEQREQAQPRKDDPA